MEKPKPCPFCGGSAIDIRTDDGGLSWYSFCNDCGVMCGYAMTKDDVMNAWNRRAERNEMAIEKIVIFHHDERGAVRTWSEIGKLVRCKDCEFYTEDERWCRRLGLVGAFDPNGYCSHAERSEDE